MKRLFGTIITLALLCMVYTKSIYQQETHSIQYCNVGPLAAVNLCMYCIDVVKDNAHNMKVLEVHAGVTQRQEQLQIALKSYKKAPQKLQNMKNKLCKTMGLNPQEIQLKLSKEKDYVSTNTIVKLVSIGNDFLRKPAQQQLGVLAHELGHVKYNDCEGQINFDIASAYVTAAGTYFVTYALHIPHTVELQKPVAQLAQSAFSRAQEKRADNEAAQVPGAAQGLMEYLEESAQHDNQDFGLYDTHPSHQERIKNLKPFAVQQGK